MNTLRLIFAVTLAALLAACGGGEADPRQVVVAFYGDSITAGRAADIAAGAFQVQDFARPAQNSDAPLSPDDRSTITVLRYGMADIVHHIPPEVTRLHLLALVAQIVALGRTPVVVNISRADDGRERATNEAIRDITTINVADIEGTTVDGIHPTDAYHAALNARIHTALLTVLRSATP